MKRLCLVIGVLFWVAVLWLALVPPVKAAGYYYPSYSYSYPTYYQTQYVYKEVPVYKDVYRVKEVVVPTYAIVPLYSSYYAPSAAPAQAPCDKGHAAAPQAAPAAKAMPDAAAAPSNACAEANARAAKLEAQMELLLRIMGTPGGQPPAAPERLPAPKVPPKAPAKPKVPPPAKEPTAADSIQAGVNAMYTACSRCHEAKAAKGEGGGFTMFDGVQVAALSERAWAKVERELDEGKMPPKVDSKGNAVPQPTPEQRKAIQAFLVERKRQAGAAE